MIIAPDTEHTFIKQTFRHKADYPVFNPGLERDGPTPFLGEVADLFQVKWKVVP